MILTTIKDVKYLSELIYSIIYCFGYLDTYIEFI